MPPWPRASPPPTGRLRPSRADGCPLASVQPGNRPTRAQLGAVGLDGPSPAQMQPYLAACDQRLQALQTEQLLRAAVRRAAGARGDVLSLVDPDEALADGGRLLSMVAPGAPG